MAKLKDPRFMTTHPEYIRGWEDSELDKLRWIKAVLNASNGNLDPEMVEEAKRILEP